jgi:hypothetical protein
MTRNTVLNAPLLRLVDPQSNKHASGGAVGAIGVEFDSIKVWTAPGA